MGISQAEIENMKARAHEAGFGVNNAKAGAIRAEAAATADAQAGDMERIVVEGEEVMIEANASDGERRNAQARLDSDVIDANREAERSGTRAGRVEITGLGSREKETAKAQAKKRAKEDARTQQLLALQAMLDAMDAEIARLDGEIDALDQLLGIIDSGEKLDPDNPAHRAILERSGIPKDKWDNVTREDIEAAKREREAERDDIETRKQNLQKEFSRAEPEDLSDVAQGSVERDGADIVATMSRDLDEGRREIVDATAGKHDHGGNDAVRNGNTDFSFVQKGHALLGDSKSILSAGTSVASVLTPGLAVQPPQITPQYNEASRGEQETPHLQEPTQVTQDQDRENTPENPTPGMGVG